MGFPAMREFFGSLKIHLFNGDFLAFIITTFFGIQFLGRKVWYQFLSTTKCGTCGGSITVYFLRSPANVLGQGSEYELCDWIICDDEECREAKPL